MHFPSGHCEEAAKCPPTCKSITHHIHSVTTLEQQERNKCWEQDMTLIGDAWNQTKALTLKNLTLQRRQWKTNLCQLFLPIVCLLCIFILNIIVTHVENEVDKTFTPYFANTPNQTTIDGIIFTLKYVSCSIYLCLYSCMH